MSNKPSGDFFLSKGEIPSDAKVSAYNVLVVMAIVSSALLLNTVVVTGIKPMRILSGIYNHDGLRVETIQATLEYDESVLTEVYSENIGLNCEKMFSGLSVEQKSAYVSVVFSMIPKGVSREVLLEALALIP